MGILDDIAKRQKDLPDEEEDAASKFDAGSLVDEIRSRQDDLDSALPPIPGEEDISGQDDVIRDLRERIVREQSFSSRVVASAKRVKDKVLGDINEITSEPFKGTNLIMALSDAEQRAGLPSGSLVTPGTLAGGVVDLADLLFRGTQIPFVTAFSTMEEVINEMSGDSDYGKNIREGVELTLIFAGVASGGTVPVKPRAPKTRTQIRQAKAKDTAKIATDEELVQTAKSGNDLERQASFNEISDRFENTSKQNVLPTEEQLTQAFKDNIEQAFANSPRKDAIVEEALVRYKASRDRVKHEVLDDIQEASGIPGTQITAEAKAVMSDILINEGFVRDPNRPLTDQFVELVQSERVSPEKLRDTVNKLGITPDQFLEGIKINATQAGQTLQIMSNISKQLRKVEALSKDGKVTSLLGEITDAGGKLSSTSRLKNFWEGSTTLARALFVSPLSTAMRNAGTVVTVRLPLDAMTRALDNGVRKLFLPKDVTEINHVNAMAPMLNLFTKNPMKNHQAAISILERFPKQHDDIFLRFASDIKLAPGKGSIRAGVDKVASISNIFNRSQDIVIRNAIFLARMDDALVRAGTSTKKINAEAIARRAKVTELIDSGVDPALANLKAASEFNKEFSKVTKRMVETAVRDALDLTFAKNYNTGASISQTVAARFIQFMNSLGPFGLEIQAFPRFLVNAAEFTFDNLGGSFLKLLSKKERAKIAAGDTDLISKGVTSVAVWYGVKELHDNFNKGNKWYELELEDGTIVDTRPIPLLAPALFIVDSLKRIEENRIQEWNLKDVAEGLLVTKIVRGQVIEALDEAVKAFGEFSDAAKLKQALARAREETLKPFAAAIKTIQDLYSFRDEQELVIRSNAEGRLFGAIQERAPELSQLLPEVQSPTREGPIRRATSPAASLFGIPFRDPKNIFEKELDRLGIPPRRVRIDTTDDVLTEALHKEMGAIIENEVIPKMNLINIRSMDVEVATEYMKTLLTGAKGSAKMKLLQSGDPEMQSRLLRDQFRRLPINQRRLLARKRPEIVRQILSLTLHMGVEDLEDDKIPTSIRQTISRELDNGEDINPPF